MKWKRFMSGFRELRPLVHLLLPLSVHWTAAEMTVSVLVDIVTNALCPGDSTCSQAIYLNGLQQTVVGVFKMVTLPLLGQLADEYGRKPFLILTVSSAIIPYALVACNQTRAFVYAFYVLLTISDIISQGSVFCIAVAYVADFVPEGKRAAAFGWITGLLSASHLLGNVAARFLPENCIFPVSVALLICCPIYMQYFLTETIELTPRREHNSTFCTKIINFLYTRYNSMKDAAIVCFISHTLRGISSVSFFYELGMSGISSVLFYYLKAAFGFSKNQYSEILMMVEIGEVLSQMVVLPLINPLVGEKVILCVGLLASIAYGLLYGLAWASWVPYLSAAFGAIDVLVTPSTYAIISRASSSENQGKTQGFVGGVKSIASLLSPLVMSPLTTYFLSAEAPFNCKGFSIIIASLCMIVASFQACLVKVAQHSTLEEDTEAPLLSHN